MLAFLLEQEYGAETHLWQSISGFEFDTLLEKGLSSILFKKYFAITRLQATIHSRLYTEDLLQTAKTKDKEILEYSLYLKDKKEYLEETNLELKKLV